jgi:hypothetical protein
MCNVFPAIFTLDRVALLTTPQDSLWPQLTVEVDGAVTVIVNVAVLDDWPAGDPWIVTVYVPGGSIAVVLIVIVEVAPCAVGVILAGAKVSEPHGLVFDWHTAGYGVIETTTSPIC